MKGTNIVINGKTYTNVEEAVKVLNGITVEERAKSMRIYKAQDIENEFTEAVKDYFDRGFRVNAQSMSGTQGEQAKVDVTDGKNIYRIRLERSVDRDLVKTLDLGKVWSIDGMQLIVERYDYTTNETLWSGRGEVVKTETYFRTGRGYRCEGAFVKEDDYEVLQARKELGYQRREQRNGQDIITGQYDYELNLSQEQREKIADMCREWSGWKTVKATDISVRRCAPDYYTDRGGKKYRKRDMMYVVRKSSGKRLAFTTNGVEVWG